MCLTFFLSKFQRVYLKNWTQARQMVVNQVLQLVHQQILAYEHRDQ